MRHPTQVRERVLARTLDMLEHLRIQVSMLAEPEIEVLKIIERPQQYELAVSVANFIMTQLGYASAPAVPRFDKMHRAMVKKRGRPPRGERAAGPPRESDALVKP